VTVKAKIVALCVGLPVVLAIGFVFFQVTRNLVQNPGAQPANGVAATIAPTTGSAAAANTPLDTPAATPIKCGAVAAKTVYGGSLQPISPLLRGIHDAACHRDYVGLLGYMENPFGSHPKKDVVAGWKLHDVDGTVLQALAEALENQPVVDQGGYTFCSPDGAVLIIGRGVSDHPGTWSGFDLTGDQLSGCAGRR
jgi:hypothetical protein